MTERARLEALFSLQSARFRHACEEEVIESLRRDKVITYLSFPLDCNLYMVHGDMETYITSHT